MKERKRYPLNVAGDFYVENEMCIFCEAPEHEAPDLMAHDSAAPAGYHCYFKRQPRTPAELERAILAVAVGCCSAVRYGGTDVAVLRRLAEVEAVDACDYRATRKGAVEPR
jgi:hypothetical protein